jgi:hypothetical protein
MTQFYSSWMSYLSLIQQLLITNGLSRVVNPACRSKQRKRERLPVWVDSIIRLSLIYHLANQAKCQVFEYRHWQLSQNCQVFNPEVVPISSNDADLRCIFLQQLNTQHSTL